ncbi:hypothetical protein, partial [Frankia canadensis]|uniref:hypothetical protein n=1 Tax=Frankia canadensis TaxID=1836972 RepID=UPI001A9C6107
MQRRGRLGGSGSGRRSQTSGGYRCSGGRGPAGLAGEGDALPIPTAAARGPWELRGSAAAVGIG